MAFIPSSGSVAAWIQSSNGSVITVGQGNQSISGTVNIGNQIGSVAAFQGGAWSVSIIGSLTPPANQSVSGAVSVSNFPANQSVSGNVGVIGNPSISGTVLIGNAPSIYGNISGSVVSFQGGAWSTTVTGTPAVSVQGTVFVSGSVITVGSAAPANQSVSGTVGASIIGSVPITGNVGITGTPAVSVQGTVFVSGSVITVGSSAPANQSVSGTVVTISQGSIAAVIIGGSIAASFTPPANQSVSGTVGASVIGNVNTTITSIAAVGGFLNVNLVGGSILTSSTANQSVSGTVGASIIGQLPAGNAVIGAVAASISGTVITTFTNSSIIALQAGSVVSINQGSIATVQIGQAGTVITSISGAVFQNAPTSSWVSGVGSLFTGVYQPIVGSVSGQFTYVTGVQAVNASANNVYLTFSGAGVGSTVGSIIGYTVVPANGGSNIVYTNALKTVSGAPFQASVSGVASVFLSAQGFTSGT